MRNIMKMLTVLSGGGGGALFDTSTFTQTYTDILTNGSFTAWTSGDPDGWSETGESGTDPEVTEVAPNAGHGGGGNGACNFFSSATSNEPRITQVPAGGSDAIREYELEVTNYVAGGLRLETTPVGATLAATGKRIFYRRQASHITGWRCIGSAPHDITADNAATRVCVLDALRTTPTPNGDFRFQFTLPASPIQGQRYEIGYRMPSGVHYTDGWIARLEYSGSQWQAGLFRVSAGTETAVIALTNAGTPNTLRVVVNGDDHSLYTGTAGIDGAFTQRGTTQTNTTHNTSTGAQVHYNSAAVVDATWRFRGQAPA